jgi:hypothetical protein
MTRTISIGLSDLTPLILPALGTVPLTNPNSSGHRRLPSSLLKKPPGEGTGPTMRADFRGNLVGRVPSRGERHVVQQTARRRPLPRRLTQQLDNLINRLAVQSLNVTPYNLQEVGAQTFSWRSMWLNVPQEQTLRGKCSGSVGTTGVPDSQEQPKAECPGERASARQDFLQFRAQPTRRPARDAAAQFGPQDRQSPWPWSAI